MGAAEDDNVSDLSMNEIDALLDALREKALAPAGPDDALTGNEIEERMAAAGNPINRKRLLAQLSALWKEGRVETVQVQRQTPTRLARVPAYRFRG